METQSWAEQEFAYANLGDKRRKKRLIQLAEQRGNQPNASISQSCEGSASAKAAYRFYENPAISSQDIMSSHIKTTQTRMSQESIVLAVQDTTQLDYSSHPATKGLGTLQTKNQHGLIMHTTLAVTPSRVPLGVIHLQLWQRPQEEFGKKHQRKKRPIDEKESKKWLSSLEATSKFSKEIPQTHIVSVADREADVYELFALSCSTSQDMLIRASWDRRVAHSESYLWSFMENQIISGSLTITVPRKGNQPSRQAELSVRYSVVTIRPPSNRKGLKPVTLYGILATEEEPPNGVEPVSWLLLTNVLTDTFEDSCERIQWYSCRWTIEIYHKVLKDGCRIEERQFEFAENIQRYLSVDMVVSWRVLYLTMLGRDMPQLPCTAIFEAYEWQSLYCFIHKTHTPPDETPSLQQAVRWIAKLGGFMGRKGDGEPGVTVLWRGLQRLYDISETWLLFHLHPSDP